MPHIPKIALLATGDELTHGDIANSNAQDIAHLLVANGMEVGMHMVVSDSITDIKQAIAYLLETHQALIIIGGLGPTSDDLTRYALSDVTAAPLVFDNATWDTIVKRLQLFGYQTPPESNRQQALFPEGATIIPNPNGTAAGCILQYSNKPIFMLPGPPKECLPLAQTVVLQELKQANFIQPHFYKKWLLFGVSEGQIAETLDKMVKPYDCKTGYRLFYPYIEFKLQSKNEKDFVALVPIIQNFLADYMIADGEKTASELLREYLNTLSFILRIQDKATGGLLEATIKTPQNIAHLNFNSQTCDIVIEGLEEYWQQIKTNQTTLHINFKNNKESKQIPFRGSRVKQYAVELICWELYKFLIGH